MDTSSLSLSLSHTHTHIHYLFNICLCLSSFLLLSPSLPLAFKPVVCSIFSSSWRQSHSISWELAFTNQPFNSAFLRGTDKSQVHLGTCSPLGPWGGQVRLWPIPPTRVTNSLRFFPPAEGCGPSGPKPHATKPASSRLQLALLTRPGTPTWLGLLSRPHTSSLCYINTHYITLYIHIALLFCILLSTFFYIHCLYICIVYIVFFGSYV